MYSPFMKHVAAYILENNQASQFLFLPLGTSVAAVRDLDNKGAVIDVYFDCALWENANPPNPYPPELAQVGLGVLIGLVIAPDAARQGFMATGDLARQHLKPKLQA